MTTHSLRDVRVSISISDSPDLLVLGHPERALDRVARDLVAALVLRGATLLYGGDLRRMGFTVGIAADAAHAWRVAVDEAASLVFEHHAAAPVWQGWRGADGIWEHLGELRDFGRTILYSSDGRLCVLAPTDLNPAERSESSDEWWVSVYRNADDETEPDEELKSPAELDRFLQSLPRTRPEVTAAEAYSTMRRGMAEAEDARVLLGGRVADSADGRPPGVAEEALLAIRAGNLVLPFPAWGGCAHDVADALGILPERFVTRTPSTGYQAQLDEVRNRSERYLRSLDGKGLSAAVRIALAEADTPSRVAQATLLALAERPDRSE